MAYEVVMPYHLHMPSYFLETFTEYPYEKNSVARNIQVILVMEVMRRKFKPNMKKLPFPFPVTVTVN